MKKDWKTMKLGEIGIVVTGSTPSTKDESNYSSKDYCFVKPSDISNETISIIQETEAYISANAYSKCRKLPCGSVLTTCIGIIGKVGILKVDATCNQQINGIIPHKAHITSEFLAYSLIARKRYLQGIANAPIVPIINKKEFSDVAITIPSITEQEKIVAELDCLSGIIEKKKQQLKELDALAQSIFYEMFGDPDNSPFPKHPLNYLSNLKLSYGSGASAVQYDGKVRYVRITDIQEEGKLDANAMSPSEYDDKYLLNDGDILFARSGATVGKTYHYKILDGKAIYAGYLIRFVPNQELVLPEYIFYFTKSDYYNAFIKKTAQAVAQPNINAKQYGDLLVCVPPIDLQQDFASKIEAIEKQKELIRSSIQETETLFNSRMDYYFG